MLPQTISPQELAERIGPGLIVLDVDGTLAPLRIDPQSVRLSKSLQKTLVRLAARRPVALVSGRPLAFLQKIAGDLPLLLVGSHGAEANLAAFRPRSNPSFPPAVRTLVYGAMKQGVVIEEKPFGLVLHFRNLPPKDRAAAQDRWRAELEPQLPERWELMRGNAVVEIRPQGIHKGTVLQPLREYAKGNIGAVLGDDITDEDMFRALQPGEVGVLVGKRRPSNALFQLSGVTDARRFLATLALKDS